MLKKISRFTALLFTALMFCFLLSPTALAAGNNYNGSRNNYASYEGVGNILLQNVGSCQNNNNQAAAYGNQGREYKLTETCPQPITTTCKQTNTANNSSTVKANSNCNSSTVKANNSCTNGTVKANSSCNNGTVKANSSYCPPSTGNTSCTAVKRAQTTTPAQSTATPNQGNTANVAVSAYAEEVVRLVNAERAKNNLAALTMDNQLAAAAQVRAQEATVKFSHTRPNGSSCFSVLSSMGISYRRAGENIAIGQSSPSQVVKAWMESPGHRANILGDYTKIGVGVQQAGSNYSGYSWAQFFTK